MPCVPQALLTPWRWVWILVILQEVSQDLHDQGKQVDRMSLCINIHAPVFSVNPSPMICSHRPWPPGLGPSTRLYETASHPFFPFISSLK